MTKALFIAEKPSVAVEFAKALDIKGKKQDGFIESDNAVVTWCIGHLVTMSYPEVYDPKYKKWNLEDLPFLPKEYKYEVISNVRKQFEIIKKQMKRKDISTIFVCTDSGREGEYIYRLVDEIIDVKDKVKKRVWIDSQTVDEIKKGVRNAKPLSEYDNLSSAAYLRAKEDYLMGINFSRLLTLCYSGSLSKELGKNYVVIAVGRVMTCVLAMIVQREREIRDFVKTTYYKINGKFNFEESLDYDGEWKVVEGSELLNSPLLYKDIGFNSKEVAENFIKELLSGEQVNGIIEDVKRKKETKNPPLLYNLAELQNELSKKLKISPEETLKTVQNLYEKKMVTYPRTDARVLTTAVAKELDKNIKGLMSLKNIFKIDSNDSDISSYVEEVYTKGLFKGIEKTKYVNDKAVTDHYAIIPTGQGLENYNKLKDNDRKTYILIVRRFLAIFFPPAVFSQLTITTKIKSERFFTTSKVNIQEGYLPVLGEEKKEDSTKSNKEDVLKKLKKGQKVNITEVLIKEAETTPPKRYSSGSIILAMENAGKLIEDEELREQIKGSGIGTSATRAGILSKLQNIDYISLNKKTQILTPTALGEMIYDVVDKSIPTLLKPDLTASWEKGLSLISNGDIKPEEYMVKLESYISKNTKRVLALEKKQYINANYMKDETRKVYSNAKSKRSSKGSLGKCIACNDGDVLENRKAYFCSNWRKKCKFTTWKDSLSLYAQDVTPELMKYLLNEGVVKALNITLPQTKEKCIADVRFKDDKSGNLELINVNRINRINKI
ncbi:DNA topoisomerase [Serpentinicella alkaliphila]|uniref:DNA topoisomerase n=1 Tax=Serpentinicella alkaliphila TaxID=1734049 RepID=A0A4R2TIC1_9FIRM|nr:DNA topoisomerase [Serpentinicella alkaliphila]QUH26454.1 type IA DNA topoisomerase [Serpentinicella alkaliphila]TCQ03268.1 DNA topoisomerase-3 [Serpentinicella alkaliphila]